MTEPLRVGVLGCGWIARAHAKAVAALPEDARIVAAASRSADTAAAFAAEIGGGVAVYPDHHAMLAEAGLDVMIVCLPPFAHTDEVAQAAARGVHLMVEKPLALDSAQAWDMVAAAEDAGIKTQVPFVLRFGAVVERLIAERDAGRLGPIGMFDARYFCHQDHADWWRDRSLSGGQLVEQVIHHVDLLRYVLGEPDEVFARQSNVFHADVPGYTIEDQSVSVAMYDDGRLGIVRGSNNAVPGVWDKAFSVIARDATVHASDHNSGTLHWTRGEPRVEDVSGPDDCFTKQLRDLVTAIRTGAETRTPLREGAKSLDLALRLTAAARD